MDDWQKQVNEEVHGSELPLVDPVASNGFNSYLILPSMTNSSIIVFNKWFEPRSISSLCDRPGEDSPEKNCCWWLTFQQPVRMSSSESSEKCLSVDGVTSLVLESGWSVLCTCKATRLIVSFIVSNRWNHTKFYIEMNLCSSTCSYHVTMLWRNIDKTIKPKQTLYTHSVCKCSQQSVLAWF